MLFVLVTTALLFLAIRRPWTPRGKRVGSRDLSAVDRRVQLGIGMSILVSAALGALQVRNVIDSHETEWSERLARIAGAEASRIERWLEERLRDAAALASELAADPVFIPSRRPAGAAARLDAYRRLTSYPALIVSDADGGVITTATAKTSDAGEPPRRGAIERALASGRPVFEEFGANDAGTGRYIDFVAPVSGAAGSAAHAVTLRADARDLRSGAPADATETDDGAEIRLFRLVHSSGNHPDATAGNGGTEANASNGLLARLARGDLPIGEVVEAIDRHGVPARAIALAVRGIDWHVLARVDRQVISSDIREHLSSTIVSFSIALILPFALGVLLTLRNRLRVMELVDRQREERVALSRHEDSLIQKARDMIFLLDDEERIVDVNESALAAYGYELDEFQSMTADDLRAPGAAGDRGGRPEEADRPQGALFETTHVRKDGTEMPVEVSSRFLDIEGRRFRQNFVRDITERRRDEDRIARLTRLYRALSECNQAIVRGRNRDALFEDVCRVVVEFGGMALAWVGVTDAERQRVVAAASYGAEGRGCVEHLGLSLDLTDPDERSLASVCTREGRVLWKHDVTDDTGAPPWRDFPGSAEWRASASLPIRLGERVEASLNVYTADPMAFADAEKQLLTELAVDVSYALEHITTRVELEQAEERWSFALEGAGEGVWDWDIAQGTVYYSTRWKSMLGYRDDEVGSTFEDWSERIHPEDRKPALDALERHLCSDDEEFSFETRLRARDGSWRWILARGKVIAFDPDGRPRRMIGTHTDITARKETEQALLEQTRMLEESQRIARIGGWTYDTGTRRMSWSTETCRIYGVDPTNLDDGVENFFAFADSRERAALRGWFDSLMAGEGPGETELRVMRPDGSVRWVNLRGVVEVDDGRRRAAGTVQDVTEWHAAETRMQEQLEELRRWYLVTLDREQRVLELKQEINSLLAAQSLPPRYETPAAGPEQTP
ncbi:MAG: PAS domain S-box protein [Proteobacteria bacterium]|nr:MAG: PAS domain S-box protein [Pseudomonadota bacterium]